VEEINLSNCFEETEEKFVIISSLQLILEFSISRTAGPAEFLRELRILRQGKWLDCDTFRLRQMSGQHEGTAVYESLAKLGAEAAK
jgi:hypothetical protein